jgi:biotin transport system ATP-binding protein
MSTITFTDVSHAFGEREVLRNINLTLTEHRIGIIGANGSGKSTLARMINGLVMPSAGTVTVDGQDVAKKARDIRRRVGFIFTNPDNQIVMPTVAEDVAFTLRRHGLSRDQVAERTQAALERFGLSGHADHPAHRLSGGQKQLLALAAVLVGEPDVVVADEPTTLLDARNARHIGELFHEMTQQVIVVTHQMELVAGFDRVIVVGHGEIVADGAPQAALDAYHAFLS